MDCKTKIKELRESTGMNRKEFCKYFQIPYRTVTEWELDNRHAPEYVLRLLEYYIRNEGLIKSPAEQKHAGERSSSHEKTDKVQYLHKSFHLHAGGWIQSGRPEG